MLIPRCLLKHVKQLRNIQFCTIKLNVLLMVKNNYGMYKCLLKIHTPWHIIIKNTNIVTYTNAQIIGTMYIYNCRGKFTVFTTNPNIQIIHTQKLDCNWSESVTRNNKNKQVVSATNFIQKISIWHIQFQLRSALIQTC